MIPASSVSAPSGTKSFSASATWYLKFAYGLLWASALQHLQMTFQPGIPVLLLQQMHLDISQPCASDDDQEDCIQ